MRRVSIALVSLFVIAQAACGEEPKPVVPTTPPVDTAPPPATTPAPVDPPPAPKPPLADLQKAALVAALDGLNSHDPKKFASVYAEDAVISVAGLNEVNGRAKIEENMTEWFEVFSKAKLGFSRVWVKGDTMVLEWVINGTHRGELFGVKGTEQPIGHFGLSIVKFNQDGKVASEHRYGELGTVMTQVGGKAKPRPIPEIPKGPETILAKGDEEKNLAVAKSALTALENKKDADFTSALTDDIEHDGMFHLETTKGKAEATKFFKSFTTAFPDAKFEVNSALAIGDYVIAESMLKATHKGPLGTIAATKKPVAIHLADVFKIKDGKIARVWTYQNSLELQHQLGLFNVATAGNVPASQSGPSSAPAKPAGTATPPATPPKTGGGGTGGGGGGGKDTGGGGGKGTGGGGGGGKK